MDWTLIIWMVGAAFTAVAIYTFIGFIPGTDETSVLLPITLGVVLLGFDPMVVLTFFIAAIVTLNLTNVMPTAIVNLPGGVMSSSMIEHSIVIKEEGRSAEIIKRMAAASAIGVMISVPLSLGLAFLLTPFAETIEPYASYLFIIGAIFLSLISRAKVLSLMAIIPLSVLFMGLRHLYWGTGVVDEGTTVTVSFFLGITVGPLLVSLFRLLNPKTYEEAIIHEENAIAIPKADGDHGHNPFKRLNPSERNHAGIGAIVVNFLFVLSPVGLTILIGESFGKRFKDKVERAIMSVTTMSAVVQATYLSGIIIPLLALGIPLSPVAIGPGNALFRADPVYTLDHNIHHMLGFVDFSFAVILGAGIALVLSYSLITRYALPITRHILKRVPHESVLALFIAFIMLLAYMDAGLVNIFGVLLVGLFSGSLHRMGVNYGVQFMSLYAAPLIIDLLTGVVA
ncbi:MAG: tripartite tricarboxylate transporter permease [Bacillota bacterium]